MMIPHDDQFLHGDKGSFGASSGGTVTMLDRAFLDRVQAFERCYTSELHGDLSFLVIAAADLLRTIPGAQQTAEIELRVHGSQSSPAALRRYMRILQVFRQTLQTALDIENG